jgi:hypothetical protein
MNMIKKVYRGIEVDSNKIVETSLNRFLNRFIREDNCELTCRTIATKRFLRATHLVPILMNSEHLWIYFKGLRHDDVVLYNYLQVYYIDESSLIFNDGTFVTISSSKKSLERILAMAEKTRKKWLLK